MSDKSSPFAGIKLSDQTPLATQGADQRLFSATPTHHKPLPTTLTPSAVPDQTTKVPSKEARKVGTLEPRKQGSSVSRESDSTSPFDINQQAYRNNTYAFTDEELDALEDIKIALRRKHNVNATKNSLIRLGIHVLVSDYYMNKADSIAVKRLKKREG